VLTDVMRRGVGRAWGGGRAVGYPGIDETNHTHLLGGLRFILALPPPQRHLFPAACQGLFCCKGLTLLLRDQRAAPDVDGVGGVGGCAASHERSMVTSSRRDTSP
jgi:hypothetical protein